MKVLFLSSEDFHKHGGCDIGVYQEMMNALELGGCHSEHRFAGNTTQLIDNLMGVSPDIVLSGAYHTFKHDGSIDQQVHEVLEELEIPYVGSRPPALDLVLDKIAAKKVWHDAGITVARYFPVNNEKIPSDAFPLLIKPQLEGSSRGIIPKGVVYDNETLQEVAAELRGQGFEKLFAETYLGQDRREFTVAVIGDYHGKICGPAELVQVKDCERPLVITKVMKDGAHGTRIFEPGVVEHGKLNDTLCDMASKMYDAAKIQDYGRCDIIMNEEGVLHATEINGQSTIESYFVTGMSGKGLDYTQTINGMVLAAIIRNQKQGHDLKVPKKMRELMPTDAYEKLQR